MWAFHSSHQPPDGSGQVPSLPADTLVQSQVKGSSLLRQHTGARTQADSLDFHPHPPCPSFAQVTMYLLIPNTS